MIEITPLHRDDRHAWQPLAVGYNAFYERVLPDATYDRTWRRLMEEKELHGLAARLDGRVVGLAHYLFHRSTTAIGPSCYLQDLFTAEAARGHGVASALIEAVAARARAAGSPRLYWQTHETNASARRLYDRVAERSGFIVYRIVL